MDFKKKSSMFLMVGVMSLSGSIFVSSSTLDTVSPEVVASTPVGATNSSGLPVEMAVELSGDILEEFIQRNRASVVAVSEDLTSRTGSQSVSFETTGRMPFYRIFVENTSRVDYTLVAPSGTTFTVQPGTNLLIWSQSPLPSRSFSASVTSKDGSTLQGFIGVRIAETLAKVNG